MAYSHKWSYSTFTALTLALAGLVGCGGSDANTPPQTPASTTTETTTTGATGSTSATGTPGATGTDMSGTGATGMSTGTGSTAGSSTGSAGSSMGTAGSAGTAGDTAAAGGSTPKADAPLTDEQIAAVTNAANTGEVDQAKEAVKKAKNAKVKQFAQHMITDHGAAFKQQNEILKKASLNAVDNPTSQQITTDGKQALATLQSATGADFDKQYMDAQVKQHQAVLDTLDNKLIPNAKNADLKAHLQATRTKVAAHLKMAQDIQGSLK